MGGPEAWDENQTIAHAVEIRDGRIENEAILDFQGREVAYPHAVTPRGAGTLHAVTSAALPARPGFVFYFGRAILKPVLSLLYWPRVSGTEHSRAPGPSIVSNHLSMLDTVLIPSFAPRNVQFLAKASLFSERDPRWFFTRIGAVPVTARRPQPRSGARGGQRRTRAESVFVVFPEGSSLATAGSIAARAERRGSRSRLAQPSCPLGCTARAARGAIPRSGRRDRIESLRHAPRPQRSREAARESGARARPPSG